METINWGIISTGNIANSFAKDFRYSVNGKLLAVASRSLQKANLFRHRYALKKAYGSYAELFTDPGIDVVYIATPHNFHLEHATEAIKCGKAVLCEKPITINPLECFQLIELSRSSHTYLMEAMWTFFLPPIRKAMEWIREGKIGQVRHLKADFGFEANLDEHKRLFDPMLAGGALLDIGIYPISMAWLLFNDIPENIHVKSKLFNTGVDLEETMVFEYSNGATADLAASISNSLSNEALIIGEQGHIKIPDFYIARECFLYSENAIVEHYRDDRKSVGYNYEIDAVNKDLMQGKKQSDIMPLETSLRIQEIMEMVKNMF